MPFFAGQKVRASELDDMEDDVTDILAYGRPIVGDGYTANGSTTSGGTELAVCTTPSFTPEANTVYLVRFHFQYGAEANAAGDVFFTRLRETNTSGTERAAARLVDFGSSTNPLAAPDAEWLFNDGATPSARIFSGSVIRLSGDGSVTTFSGTSLIVYKLGTPTNFTV